MLLGLYRFFELARGNEPEKAVEQHLKSLMILPATASDADMASALSKLDEMMVRRDSNPVLRGEHLRHLLLDAMRCRLELHHRGGYHGNAPPPQNAEQARLLVIFANRVKPNYLPGDTLIQVHCAVKQFKNPPLRLPLPTMPHIHPPILATAAAQSHGGDGCVAPRRHAEREGAQERHALAAGNGALLPASPCTRKRKERAGPGAVREGAVACIGMAGSEEARYAYCPELHRRIAFSFLNS